MILDRGLCISDTGKGGGGRDGEERGHRRCPLQEGGTAEAPDPGADDHDVRVEVLRRRRQPPHPAGGTCGREDGIRFQRSRQEIGRKFFVHISIVNIFFWLKNIRQFTFINLAPFLPTSQLEKCQKSQPET